MGRAKDTIGWLGRYLVGWGRPSETRATD